MSAARPTLGERLRADQERLRAKALSAAEVMPAAPDAIEITIFTEKPGTPARYVNQGERVPGTLAELFSKPLPREKPKDDLPFYSGTQWEGDNRSEGTPYLAERFLGYDLDAAPVPSRETVRAVMTALGLTWHLTPSSSHTLEKPALRLIVDPHRDIAPADFPRVSKALAERFAEHLTFPVASNSHSHAHCWCWPRVPEGGEWFYDSGRGSPLDLEALLRSAPPALADVEVKGPALVKPETGPRLEQGRQRAIMHAGTGPGQIGPCIEKDKHGRNGQAWIWRTAQYLGLTCKLDLDTAWAIFDEHYNPLCFARDGVTPYPWPREGKQGFDRAFKRAVRSNHAASDAATAKLAESVTAKNAATTAPPVASDEAPAGMTSDAASAPLPESEGISAVFDTWKSEGPIVHEATGLPKLDEATGGGPVYGTRWALLGAPDAGKTALLVQIGHEYAKRGIHVGFLAVDEESGDIVTRLAQRAGFSREQCETRDPATLEKMRAALTSLPIHFYGVEHTIESAAADLRRRAEEDTAEGEAMRCFLAIDSIQTVRCHASAEQERTGREVSPRAIVTSNVYAVRDVATQYRMIAIFTSEMARRNYQSEDAADKVNDMAAGKESGAIEYCARVQLALRSVKGEPDLLELGLPKNKHGSVRDPIHMKIHRGRMTLTECEAPAKVDAREVQSEKGKSAVLADAVKVAKLLAAKPGLGTTAIEDELKAAYGSFSHARVGPAIARLGDAAVKKPGERTAVHHFLDGAKLPKEVLDLIPVLDRAALAKIVPPGQNLLARLPRFGFDKAFGEG